MQVDEDYPTLLDCPVPTPLLFGLKERKTPAEYGPRHGFSPHCHKHSFPLALPPATQSIVGWKCATAGTAVMPSPSN